MRRGLLLIIPVAVVVGLAWGYVHVSTGLAAERDNVQTAWGEVAPALDHRAELVVSLVQTIEEKAPAEIAPIKGALAAHSEYQNARDPRDKIRANRQLDQAIARLLLAAEHYPGLDHGKPLNDLEGALKDADNDIAVARNKYNDAVEHYNARLTLFPNNVVAQIAGLHKIDVYFQTAADVVQ